MNCIKKELLKKLGYTPTDNEIENLYRSGLLILTDKEEDIIIKYFKY